VNLISISKLTAVSTTLLILSACGPSLPDCGSDTVKSTLLSLVKEKIVGGKTGEWYVEPNIEIINTEQKTSNKIQCKAQINFKIPEAYKNSKTEQINLAYDIQINEVNKDQFSVTANLLPLASVITLNNLGFESYENYLFEKVGLEKFTDKFKDDFEVKLKNAAMLGATFQLIIIKESYGYPLIKQYLTDAGWNDDGSGQKNKNIQIFSKDNYTLNVPVEGNLLTGAFVKWDDVKIWDK
jgi:hypothetical protein